MSTMGGFEEGATPPPAVPDDRVDILIVDDAPGQRMAVEAVLADLGENVVSVESGREALRYLLDHDVAVVLLDVNMPDVDGFETAALIRQRPRSRNTPIIFLTAGTDELHAARGYSLGAVDYLFSPFLPDILRSKVKVFVELARMHIQTRRLVEQRVALAAEQAARAAAEASNLRLSVLAEASRVLTQPLDNGSMLDDLLRAVIPQVADLAGLMVTDARVAQRDVWLHVAPDGRFGPPLTSTALYQEVHDAVARVSANGKMETLIARDRNAIWAIVVPLQARAAAFGAIAFAMAESGRCYTAADVDLARDCASRTAIAFENRILYHEIEERDRRKDEFLAMLAHELRNPLGAISNAINVLEKVGGNDADAMKLRTVISRQTQHLSRLVNELLDMARVTTGRISIERRPVALAELAERVLAAATATGKTTRHHLTWSGEPVWVTGDAFRLEQVVGNLIDNAMRYTPRDGRIELSVRREGAEAVLRVRDNGQGISVALLPRIFDLFVRGTGSHERTTVGLGLGLPLVRRLAELHGGTVHAVSRGEGLGSEFIVRLPASETPGTSVRTPAVSTLRSARIMIVEDNDDARETLRTMLELDGHQVLTAATGEEGLDRISSGNPEIVLVDLGLPGMDGFEMARRLRAAPRGADIPIVAITGYGQPLDRERTRAAGFHAHLVKPVDPSLLRAVLSACVAVASSPGAASPRRGSGHPIDDLRELA